MRPKHLGGLLGPVRYRRWLGGHPAHVDDPLTDTVVACRRCGSQAHLVVEHLSHLTGAPARIKPLLYRCPNRCVLTPQELDILANPVA